MGRAAYVCTVCIMKLEVIRLGRPSIIQDVSTRMSGYPPKVAFVVVLEDFHGGSPLALVLERLRDDRN